jgi:hypothetical protein
MHRFVLLLVLAGVVLCCLGVLPSSPVGAPEVPSPDVPSVLAGTHIVHMDRGVDAPAPFLDASYLLTPAEEGQRAHTSPVNDYLLTMLLLACSAGASVLRMLLTNARRQGAACSWSSDDRPWLTVAHKAPSFLGVFRL